jgi:cytidylate kinase
MVVRIITVSREFGSGGREVGKRLADELGFAYYDREIVEEIASRCSLDEDYVAHALERSVAHTFPLHFGHTFASIATPVVSGGSMNLLAEQTKLIKELASKGDCVIVGRAADVILSDFSPFNLFVYADMKYKVERCMSRASSDEKLTKKETEKMIKKIDAERRKLHAIISDVEWGNKDCYHLCVNTGGMKIKEIVPAIATYANAWFDAHH